MSNENENGNDEAKERSIEVAKEILRRALRGAPEHYSFIVIGLDTEHQTAVASSSHKPIASMTVAELEQAYRHYIILEHFLDTTIADIEEALPPSVREPYMNKKSAPEFKN